MKLNILTWYGALGMVLVLLIFCILFGTTAVALCRGPKLIAHPCHFYILLALYCCSFFFVIGEFISAYGYWEEKEAYCEVLERVLFILQQFAETLIASMYYLRLHVFIGSNGFYHEWVRYGCWFAVSWPSAVGLPVNFFTVKVLIDKKKRCAIKANTRVSGALWSGLLVPSTFFFLLFVLPIRSSRLQQYIWKQSLKKQIWITLLATLNDIIFEICLASISKFHNFIALFHMAIAVLLSTFIFSDWRRRLQPCKYSSLEHNFRRKEEGRSVEDLSVQFLVVQSS